MVEEYSPNREVKASRCRQPGRSGELEDVAAWRARPLDALYPIAYFDAIMVKVTEGRSVKTRACYLAVGVSLEGEREILGLWWQETEGREVLAGRAQ